MKRFDRTNPRRRRGSILIVAMAMLIVLTSMVLMLARSMRTEELASANYVAEMQADAAAHGAAEYVRSVLNGIQGQMPDDTTLYAQGAQVGPGYFWLLKHDLGNTTGAAVYAFGLTDEQSKINLNYSGATNASGTASFTSATTLSLLPNMTTELAANITAWRNASGTSTSGGAESSYYLSLTPAYQAKNNNFETVEEMLMVEGITPQILYGTDTNRNGIIDANDTDPNNPANGPATPGGLNTLPGQSTPGGMGSSGSGGNSMITAPSLNQNFHGLADYVTVYGNGQLNLNSAPQEVLQCIAGLSQSQAQSIIAYRQSHGGFPSTTTQQQLTAILTQIIGTPAIVQILAGRPASQGSAGNSRRGIAATPATPAVRGRVTTRTNYCSADIVATDATGRAFKRYQVVYKTNTTPPSIVYWRDLTSLGWPLDDQILADLRSGKPMTAQMGTASTNGTQTGAQ